MIAACFAAGFFETRCDECPTLPEHWRKANGCDGPTASPCAKLPTGESLFECPGRMVTASTAHVLRAWQFSQVGILPCSGALLDQTAVFVDACAIIGRTIGLCDAWQRKNSR